MLMGFNCLAPCRQIQALDDLADTILAGARLYRIDEFMVNCKMILALFAELR
jgi:hypothetical protein